MKRLTLFLLFALLAAPCIAQGPGPVYDREQAPASLTFGSLSSVAPFNGASGYTTVSNAGQLDPPDLIQSDNTFTSTSDFNVIEQTSPATTFSVASNVGTITPGAGTVYLLGDSHTSFTVPDVFAQVEVTSNGDTGSEFGVALSNGTGSTYLFANVYHNTNCYLVLYTASTYNNMVATGCSFPSTPWRLGLSLVGNDACMWMNSGSGWTTMGCADTSTYYNFETDGNLSGFETAIRIVSSSSTPWNVSNLVTGGFGGVGLRDVYPVSYPDGRPYIDGTKLYLTADPDTPDGQDQSEIYTYDFSSGTLTPIGAIWADSGTATQPALPNHIIYDPADDTEYVVGADWNAGGTTIGNTKLQIGKFSISTLDLLGSGIHVLTGMTQMTVPYDSSVGWDPSLACTQWNYSTGVCSYWLLAWASSNGSSYNGALAYNTNADPTSGTWTGISGSLPGSAGDSEGVQIYRVAVANGSSGVSWYVTDSCCTNATARATYIYSAAGTALGSWGVTLPSAVLSPYYAYWLAPVAYGNKVYLFGFNGNAFGTNGNSGGNFIVAVAPRF